jgi:hypothetical protein
VSWRGDVVNLRVKLSAASAKSRPDGGTYLAVITSFHFAGDRAAELNVVAAAAEWVTLTSLVRHLILFEGKTS